MSLPFFWVTGQWMEEVLPWAWTISWDSHLWFWWVIYLTEIVWLEFYSSQKQVSLFLKTSLFGTKKWSQYVGTKNCKFLNGHMRSCSTERLKMANKTNKQKMFTALYERLNLQFLHLQQLDGAGIFLNALSGVWSLWMTGVHALSYNCFLTSANSKKSKLSTDMDFLTFFVTFRRILIICCALNCTNIYSISLCSSLGEWIPSIHLLQLIHFRVVVRGQELTERERERVLTERDKQPASLTLTPRANLKTPINLTHACFWIVGGSQSSV